VEPKYASKRRKRWWRRGRSRRWRRWRSASPFDGGELVHGELADDLVGAVGLGVGRVDKPHRNLLVPPDPHTPLLVDPVEGRGRCICD